MAFYVNNAQIRRVRQSLPLKYIHKWAMPSFIHRLLLLNNCLNLNWKLLLQRVTSFLSRLLNALFDVPFLFDKYHEGYRRLILCLYLYWVYWYKWVPRLLLKLLWLLELLIYNKYYSYNPLPRKSTRYFSNYIWPVLIVYTGCNNYSVKNKLSLL